MIDLGVGFFDPKIARRKTVFLLHALEASLFNYVCDQAIALKDLPVGVVTAIRERAAKRGADLSAAGVTELLENAYLDEVFDSAIKACEHLDSAILLKALRSKCRDIELFEIRNACAHPAREFPVFYWYRMACIAADPLISMLKMDAVLEALISAEDDRISDPPPEWLERFNLTLPNNLPPADHEVTGLVGREKDVVGLIEKLQSSGINRVALTGYGGVGKTALALQVLGRVCSDRTLIPAVDGVVYVSLKEEQLTDIGLVPISSDLKSSIDSTVVSALKESGFPDADSVFHESLEARRIILCVDNAETLLKEENEVLTKYLDSLPQNWKVLLTSRLTVDGARSLPVAPLGKAQSEFLARRYLVSRNLSADSELPRHVASASRGNPLCVRLMIDRIALGRPVEEASTSAAADLVQFSFSHLIDALPEVSTLILEALYLTKVCGRADLVDLLQLSDDDVVHGMRMLQRTSLITTSFDEGGHELLTINDAVADLLTAQPQLLDRRKEIEDRLRLREQRAQAQMDLQDRSGLDPWHWNYVPKALPAALKDLLIENNRMLSQKSHNVSRERLIRLSAKFSASERSYANNSYFWKSRARLLDKLGDPSADAAFKKSVEFSDDSGPTTLLYASYLNRHGRCRDSCDLLLALIGRGVHKDENLDVKARRNVVHSYARSLRDLDRFEDVIEFSLELGQGSDLFGGYAPFLISSLRQSRSLSQLEKFLKCFEVVERCVEIDARSPALIEEVAKLLDEAVWCREHKKLDDELWILIVDFVRQYRMPLSEFRSERFDADRFLESCSKVVSEESVPLNQDELSLVENGYIPVYVKRIPAKVGTSFASFIFCKASDGEMFFCHKASLSDTDIALWQDLSLYDRLFLLPEASPSPGKFRSSISTVVLARSG